VLPPTFVLCFKADRDGPRPAFWTQAILLRREHQMTTYMIRIIVGLDDPVPGVGNHFALAAEQAYRYFC
jgi:hypothetical protein